MKIRRLAAVLLALALLTGNAATALAAKAGSAEDPLISQSYLNEKYINSVLDAVRALIDSKLAPVKAIVAEHGAVPGPEARTLPQGESLIVKTGGSIIPLRGELLLDLVYGCVLNLTTGEEQRGNVSLQPGELYVVAEYSIASVSAVSAAELATDGPLVRNNGGSAATFSDVQTSHWAYNHVETMAALGVVTGRGGGIFDPESKMTRADFVTMLGRLYGVDTSGYQSSDFTDVDAAAYYAPYVNWAASEGLVDGYGGGLFGPKDNITREQMAVLTVSFADYAGIALPSSGEGQPFTDDAEISGWAREGVYTARNAGYVGGLPGGAFNPKGNASRCEVCTILHRLIISDI